MEKDSSTSSSGPSTSSPPAPVDNCSSDESSNKKSASSSDESSKKSASSDGSSKEQKEPKKKKLFVARDPREWDPFNAPSEWLTSATPVTCTSRIKKDLKSLYEDAPYGIFLAPEEADITRLHAVIIGPPDTPYEGGFFYFILRCPPDYPIVPPRVRFMTTDGGRVRFNPNLYSDGKVCLSILGTWSGPAWSPASSLSCVLLSIQSLLNDEPYRNEPGFEQRGNLAESKAYSQMIRYETVRVAVINHVSKPHSLMPDSLQDVMRQWFLDQYESNYLPALSRLMSLDGTQFKDPFSASDGVFNVSNLSTRMTALYNSITKVDLSSEQ